MNTSEQTTLLDSYANAYRTLDTEFKKLLDENKTETLGNFISKHGREWGIKQVFPKEQLESIKEQLPILNGIQSYEELAKLDGQVVRYFCFAQDILESEMQISMVMKRSLQNKTIEEYLQSDKIHYLNFRDAHDSELFEQFDMDEDILLCDRNNVIATPIPYQNEWMNKVFESKSSADPLLNSQNTFISKKLTEYFKNQGTPQGYTERDFSSGALCLIKFYETLEGKISLNNVIEVVGILQFNLDNLKNYVPAPQDDTGNFPSIDSLYPSAFFPRLHAINFAKYNLPALMSQPIIAKSLETEAKLEAGKAKEEILNLLNVITGDEKASMLLLANLISRIYVKRELDTLGKLALNLTNAEQTIKIIKKDGNEKTLPLSEVLYTIIEKLLPFSFKLDMSIKNISELAFKPQKDINLNCLKRGALQFAHETFLFVDETKLETGTLGEKAIRNVQALIALIQNQSLIYDFIYSELTIDTDVKTLIVSQGKTLLTADLTRKLATKERVIKEEDEIYEVLFGNSIKWEAYRKYIVDCIKIVEDIEIPKEVSKQIETDYVAEVKNNPKVIADVLNMRLTISRYLTAIDGKKDFDFETYKKSKEFDQIA